MLYPVRQWVPRAEAATTRYERIRGGAGGARRAGLSLIPGRFDEAVMRSRSRSPRLLGAPRQTHGGWLRD